MALCHWGDYVKHCEDALAKLQRENALLQGQLDRANKELQDARVDLMLADVESRDLAAAKHLSNQAWLLERELTEIPTEVRNRLHQIRLEILRM